ncbi:hypothetical protein THAOC_16865 [Thalassiosira oceanica]|uniref:C2HC zinc finger plants domain-containing protein n=1 Tax=Thalassiosira oceanica TaxID=159749 RepID=K0SNJ5_THAOC|nr:hypothetical protein THAOC_16865 [Thalassiosira oceanica]|eukprot:EJK62521.1 hypothetical protein THAOC_16865 [Thalassiosira oceanica]
MSLQQNDNDQDHQHRWQHGPQQHQGQVSDLIRLARTSATTNPADALDALMQALTLQTGTQAAADQAMGRIRTELGDVVADCIAGKCSARQRLRDQQQISDEDMHRKALAVVQDLLNDSSTFLYAQNRQHILQQAMEDGSSVVCSQCGDMVKIERWEQHKNYWCRAIERDAKESDEEMDM